MDLDYSALNEPVAGADIAAYKQAIGSKVASTSMYIVMYASFIMFFVLIPSFLALVIAGTTGLLFSAIFSIITMGLVIVIVRRNSARLARLYKFSIKNNLVLRVAAPAPDYTGMIFREGDSRRINEALVFPDGKEIGNYQYTTGSGKNSTEHYWSYVHIKLTRQLPNMILDAKKNDSLGFISDLPESIKKNQTLSLEGDFDKYFTLYAPAEYKTDALYVFTPDTMAAILDADRDYDIEIIGDSLFFYRPKPLALESQKDLSEVLSLASKIGAEIQRESQLYSDDKVGDPSQNTIAQPGRVLQHHTSIFAIIAIILIIALNVVPIIIRLATGF